jgi:hypothetical protein
MNRHLASPEKDTAPMQCEFTTRFTSNALQDGHIFDEL